MVFIACATSANTLRKGSLRIQFEIDLAAEHQFFKKSILTHIATDVFLYQAGLEQQPESEVIHTNVVADDDQVLGNFAQQG